MKQDSLPVNNNTARSMNPKAVMQSIRTALGNELARAACSSSEGCPRLPNTVSPHCHFKAIRCRGCCLALLGRTLCCQLQCVCCSGSEKTVLLASGLEEFFIYFYFILYFIGKGFIIKASSSQPACTVFQNEHVVG